jgi:hypothetical protein
MTQRGRHGLVIVARLDTHDAGARVPIGRETRELSMDAIYSAPGPKKQTYTYAIIQIGIESPQMA